MSNAEREKSRRHVLTVAAEVATVVALLVTIAGLLIPHLLHKSGSSASSSSGATGSAAAQPPAAPQPAASTGRAGQRVFLDQVEPDAGGTNRGELPHTLTGQPGYDHPIVIPCATNRTGDKFRSVTYALNRRYSKLHAVLRPFVSGSEESIVQFQVFADQQPPTAKNVQVNSADAVDVDVFGVGKMEIRITCETPNATAILVDAYIERT